MKTSEETFEATDGLQLLERSWQPAGAPRAAVLIVHGYAEHSGRYVHVAKHLVANGYAVHAFDLRGHGGSQGKRVYVRSLDEHLADLDAFVARVRERTPDVALFLLGHSMGGTIVALFLLSGTHNVRGAVLSGAGLMLPGGLSRIGQAVVSLLGRIVPKLAGRKLAADAICRDEAVVAEYENDPLVYRGGMPAGTAASLIRAIRAIEARREEIVCPLLLLHGTEDSVTDPEGSKLLYEHSRSPDKTLKLYEGFYHEVLNEPEKAQVLADLTGWLDKQTAQG